MRIFLKTALRQLRIYFKFLLIRHDDQRACANWKEDNTVPFRVSCKVCAKVASLWLSWFFPVFSPAADAKAR